MAKQKVPSAEEIKEKLEEFEKVAEESLQKKRTVKSPTMIFLDEIKEVIGKSIKGGVSYAQIARDIKEVFSFSVSTQTIRAFAQNELGISPRKREKKEPEKEPEKAVKNEPEKEVKKELKLSDEIKEDLAEKKPNESEVTL